MTNLQVPDNTPDPDTLRAMAMMSKVNRQMAERGVHGIGCFMNDKGEWYFQTTDGSEVPQHVRDRITSSLETLASDEDLSPDSVD